jgi:hypothetical protein
VCFLGAANMGASYDVFKGAQVTTQIKQHTRQWKPGRDFIFWVIFI